MTSDGSAYARLRRAIQAGSLPLIRVALGFGAQLSSDVLQLGPRHAACDGLGRGTLQRRDDANDVLLWQRGTGRRRSGSALLFPQLDH